MKSATVLALVLFACTPKTETLPRDIESRLARLEETNKRYSEALEFLNSVYKEQQRQKEAEEAKTIAEDGVWAVDVTADVAAGQVDGPASAPITIVKAFDFACPYCYRAASTMDELVAQHKGEVRIVYKNLVVHPVAMPAHLASCAAAMQGKYLAFKDAFWEKAFVPYNETRDVAKLGEPAIIEIAKELKLDMKRLAVDMASDACKKQIMADMADLEKFHVDATPTFFVNGTMVSGAQPQAVFEEIITAKLAIAKASGVAPAEYYEKEIFGKGEKVFRSKKTPKPR